MMSNEEEEKEVDPDAVDGFLDVEDAEEDEEGEDEDAVDEFGGGGEEELKSRDWE